MADADSSSTTDPTLSDSDGDGLVDGAEDQNGDGAVDEEETDPSNFDTDGDGYLTGLRLKTFQTSRRRHG